MKAIVCHRYGSPDVLRCEEIETPVPGENQVLVKVHATSVNPLDWHGLRGKPVIMRLFFGALRPKRNIPGADFAGRVEAVGKNVTQFRPGDEVFGSGPGGGFAEYVCISERGLVPKPANISFAEAAAVPVAALTALQSLRDVGQVQPGQKVLVNGAAGGVGTYAVQIAKVLGAEVTGVCSTRNLDLVRSLGADHVIDYTREDFTRTGQRYDLIIDAVGNRSFAAMMRALTPTGLSVLIGASFGLLILTALLGPWMKRTRGKKMSFMMARVKNKDLVVLKELLETGKIRSVIDRSYPLTEAADALWYLGKKHARGKVIITV